jgi:hypothetical protein
LEVVACDEGDRLRMVVAAALREPATGREIGSIDVVTIRDGGSLIALVAIPTAT